MSTPPHQSLRHRLIDRFGGVWRREAATGDHILVADDGTSIRLIQDDLALTRRDRLWDHLQALSARRERLAVLVSLAPLPNRSATLLAPDVWRALLRAAGLHLSMDLADPADVTDATRWTVAWHRADPYRLGGVARTAFVLEPGIPDPPEAAATLVRRLVGPQHRDVSPGTRIGFLVSSYQDFHTLQPWFSRLAVDDRVLVLRDAAIGHAPDVMDDLRAALVPYDRLPTILDEQSSSVLAGATLDVLVSASESTANLAHLGNAATLLIARALGVATVHAQHGIWPRVEFPPPVSSVADIVMAWSDEYREVIAPPSRLAVTGAPRFDRYVDRVHRHVSGLYGGWTARYVRHVVLATNLHWGQHTAVMDTRGLIADLAARHPHTLFTVKPHPYETPPLAEALPPNVVVLPQAVMLAAGIEPADVVEAADLVVTTPSTFALEAALAGRPYLVLATGNANRHDHIAEHDATTLADWLRDDSHAVDCGPYAARYSAPQMLGKAFDRTLEVVREISGTAACVPTGTALVVDGILGALTRLSRDHARERAETTRYVESLEWTLERKDAYIATLHARRGAKPS